MVQGIWNATAWGKINSTYIKVYKENQNKITYSYKSVKEHWIVSSF